MRTIIFVCSFLLIGVIVQAQKPLKKWLRSREWAAGSTLQPHETVNEKAFYAAWQQHPERWKAAFNFLAGQDLMTITPGKYPIIGDEVFASVTEAPSRNKEDVKWESHKKYIDLQYIIRGKEIIGVADVANAKITVPYTPDAMNYEVEGKYYLTNQSTFFLFFPQDAHRPTIKAEGFDVVKKVVIKIML
jgi:biofilm protein TabA